MKNVFIIHFDILQHFTYYHNTYFWVGIKVVCIILKMLTHLRTQSQIKNCRNRNGEKIFKIRKIVSTFCYWIGFLFHHHYILRPVKRRNAWTYTDIILSLLYTTPQETKFSLYLFPKAISLVLSKLLKVHGPPCGTLWAWFWLMFFMTKVLFIYGNCTVITLPAFSITSGNFSMGITSPRHSENLNQVPKIHKIENTSIHLGCPLFVSWF